jgi:hypothetical protein
MNNATLFGALFDMPDDGIYGSNWTDDELDLIVADYFEMLRMEQAGRSFVKTDHNRNLQIKIGRTQGSIEFKHQNISAILSILGLPRIKGYRPAVNAQNAIYDAIGRYMTKNPTALEIAVVQLPSFHEGSAPFIEPAPTLQSIIEKPEGLKRLIRKFDPVERDFRNRKLGYAGEEFVFQLEIRRLETLGCSDLSKRVRWISQEDGDGAGYDILSFEPGGKEKLIEVKTTYGASTTPFYITQNELSVADERPDHFKIYRLFEFSMGARMFEIAPPIENFVHLSPLSFRASFD